MSTVFITGGAVRIGKRLAQRFAEQGWNVGITFFTSASEADQTVRDLLDRGVKAAAVQCDVKDEQQLQAALETLEREVGTPMVVVSNAGIFPDRRGVDDLTPEALRETLDVNTVPLLTIGRWISAHPAGEGPSRLISLSSLGGFEIWRDRIDYNVSKTALIRLVETLARALAPSVTVNSVAPGAITEGMETTDADGTAAPVSRIPMGRHGTPDDIFDAVWFLSTASAYITGQTIIVDGGYHLVR